MEWLALDVNSLSGSIPVAISTWKTVMGISPWRTFSASRNLGCLESPAIRITDGAILIAGVAC